MPSHALYLHIPFCSTRCTYCAFNTYTGAEAHIPAYVHALQSELRCIAEAAPTLPIHTVYFGGGTPSLLKPAQVGAVIDAIRANFALDPAAEITLEVNPRSVNDAYFDALRAVGVNRLSIGMQSAQTKELRLMARDHDVETVPRTVRRARAAGFDNLSLDLIFALPYQTLEMWRASLEAALELAPQHLSMYALELEDGTVMTQAVRRGTLPLPDEDLAAEMYDLADHLTAQAGLAQYEISNWARLGCECLHNLQYWYHAPYLGVGAGAHGYAAGIRYQNVRGITEYLARANHTAQPRPFPLTNTVETHDEIDHQTAMLEHLFTGLRLVREGVSLRGSAERFGTSLEAVYGAQIATLKAQGLLVQRDDRLLLTPQARLVSNRVFVTLV